MSIVNRIVGRLFDGLLYPFRGLPPLVGLIFVSLLVALFVLWIYRVASDQERLATAKRRMQAGFFEIRLYDDDLRFILKGIRDILRHNLSYLRLSLVPLLWMIVPLVLVMAQLQSFYGHRAFRPGETFLVTVELPEDSAEHGAGPRGRRARPAAELRLPPGLRAETEAAWIRPLSEIAWRVRAEAPGQYRLEVQMEDATATKEVRVADGVARLSPVRRKPAFWSQLLDPAEPPLASALPLASIRVDYPARDITVFGLRLPWLVVFIVLVLVFALVLKSRFRVTF